MVLNELLIFFIVVASYEYFTFFKLKNKIKFNFYFLKKIYSSFKNTNKNLTNLDHNEKVFFNNVKELLSNSSKTILIIIFYILILIFIYYINKPLIDELISVKKILILLAYVTLYHFLRGINVKL